MSLENTEFVYRIPGVSSGKRPGSHFSLHSGSGLMFASHTRLFDHPDPRRIDFRASLNNVHGEWLVRSHYQRSVIGIRVIVDVSASMHFGAQRSKLDQVADFLGALGLSAYRAGDSVSLLAFDQAFREDLYVPAQFSRSMASNLSQRVRLCQRRGRAKASVAGLLACVERSSAAHGIVFLVSDFHWSLDWLEPLMAHLGKELVVPIVVWDPAEVEAPRQGGFVSLYDAESGRYRRLWLREKIRQQWRDNMNKRRIEIKKIFGHYDIRPFYLEGRFDAEAMSKYFLEQVT